VRARVTYLGNEGYLIGMGDSKVLIDGLFRSDHYACPSEETIEAIVGRFLRGDPTVTFLANTATCGRLEGEDLAGRRRQDIDLTREGETIRFG